MDGLRDYCLKWKGNSNKAIAESIGVVLPIPSLLFKAWMQSVRGTVNEHPSTTFYSLL